MSDFITRNADVLLFILMAIIATGGYFIGKEIGYCEGLEDGFKDGQYHASR
jgi:hypothetical protein